MILLFFSFPWNHQKTKGFVTASVTKNSYEDRGPCYLHLEIVYIRKKPVSVNSTGHDLHASFL